MKRLIISMMLAVICMVAHSQSYPRCILAGDYADPTILRDGKDFYMTHSMFQYTPGFLIWHSQDLVNWEPVTHVVTKGVNCPLAPDLHKHNGKYYLYFPDRKTTFVCIADKIEGPWTEPIEVKGARGIDPGHIVDVKTGKRYLFTDKGLMAPLNDKGTALTKPMKTVYSGWDIPKDWVTEGKWPEKYLESPKLLFLNGYYYLTSAEGGTAGPPTSHMVVTARSKSLEGPWEESPYNPVIHTWTADDQWWSKGHGTIFDDANGNWWIVYHAYPNNFHTLGRYTLLEPLEYTEDGWFRTKKEQPLPVASKKIKHGLDLSDDFSGEKLGFQWTIFKDFDYDAITLSNKKLTLKGRGASVAKGRVLTVIARDKSYDVKVRVQNNTQESGLCLFYDERAFSGITSDGNTLKVYDHCKLIKTVPYKSAANCWLRLRNQENILVIEASKNGRKWKVIATGLELSDMNHNNLSWFRSLRPALISVGNGTADFYDFQYIARSDS